MGVKGLREIRKGMVDSPVESLKLKLVVPGYGRDTNILGVIVV